MIRKFSFMACFFLSVGCRAQEQILEPGDTFKDCDLCPEMVVLPTGKGWVGLHPKAIRKRGLPFREIEFTEPLAVGKFEVLMEEYFACVSEKGCLAPTTSYHEALARSPVHNISWHDAKAYVTWLIKKTGKSYRLLSRNEWEYAARAGTDTLYWWGDEFKPGYDVCFGCNPNRKVRRGSGVDGDNAVSFSVMGGAYISPIPHNSRNGSRPNPFGLYYMLGNVGEWLEDCLDNVTSEQFSNTAAPEGAALNGQCRNRYYKAGQYDTPAERLMASRARARPPEFKGRSDIKLGMRVALNY